MRKLLTLSVSAFALSACASQELPPAVSYDAEDFKAAAIEPEPPRPVQIVKVPKALPLPGQLQREPGKGSEDNRPPTQRVADANKAATQEPTKYGYVNAIQVYPYTDGALYRLYAAPERVSDIGLQPGERLTSVSAGDTVRWVIGDTVSGAGDTARTHVLVKPFAPDLKTNLVITTDRRAYHLQLESTNETAMAAISWTYPADQLLALRRQNTAAKAALPVASNLSLENIHFRYAISGDTPAWRPVRAFDDGRKVYIEFPRRIDQGEAPPLFVVGADGGNELVNYRMRGNYYIVDRLFAAAELRLGTKPQQVVRISRTDRKRRQASLLRHERSTR
ncbi:P-type conjugative transfer protein TrbG [Roseibium aggregatum]|uniref:P-type conjugative transfer protein TrbG n=1 Tax=Roseibium aggregatum TaxID=187304 RepID=A0A926S8K0_9HYPH|nr:P-type conjugative transfer protein TrbG [Roseibium aggregatum]MBD1549670.1 P-type conjugative transfer protein TrbG [Roseibium aggregatum]